MRTIKPSATLVTMVDYDEMLRDLETMGRVCYKSEGRITDGSAEKFLKSIVKRGHESVIEHKSISVRIICDRGITHEIVRHRIASYSQESTRYCNYSKRDIDFIVPDTGALEEDVAKKAIKVWEEAMEFAEKKYNELIDLGVIAQFARSVLPTSTKTEIVMTMNLREWRHFLSIRSDSGAHPDMILIAGAILYKFSKMMPCFFEDILDKYDKDTRSYFKKMSKEVCKDWI